MRLRTRFADEIRSRMTALLPEAMATVWDVQSVVVAVEQIKFTSAGGLEGEWLRKASLSGVAVAELRADEIDTLEVEPLIASLVTDPPHLVYEAGPVGQFSERARFVLADWRDVIRDSQVASALRFSVEATISEFVGPGWLPNTAHAPGDAP